MRTFEELLDEMKTLYESAMEGAPLSDEMVDEECPMCGMKHDIEEECCGKEMGIPDEAKIDSPKNVGKMIESIQPKKYGSLGKVNITISLGE